MRKRPFFRHIAREALEVKNRFSEGSCSLCPVVGAELEVQQTGWLFPIGSSVLFIR